MSWREESDETWRKEQQKKRVETRCECGKRILMRPNEEYSVCIKCGKIVMNKSVSHFHYKMKNLLQ